MKFKIELYSGGVMVRSWEAISINTNRKNKLEFIENGTQKNIVISGTYVVESI